MVELASVPGLGGLVMDRSTLRRKASGGSCVGAISAVDHVAAKPIVASRIKFGPPPLFDPLPFLDERTAAMYECPQSFFKDLPDEPPKVAVRATADEKLSLFRQMASCGRLAAVGENEADEQYASGLFAVGKNVEFDRLIMDCRPANGREHGLNHWTAAMASSVVLSQIELSDDEDLLMSREDVQDYFYQFKISRDRCRRNALVGKLSQSELTEIFGEGHGVEDFGFAALNTMAMGDLCACEFAQCSHLSVLFRSSSPCILHFLVL